MACTPGFKPEIFETKVTIPFFSINDAVPVTLLLDFDSNESKSFLESLAELLVLQPNKKVVINAIVKKVFFILV
jgi:ribosomal protein L5